MEGLPLASPIYNVQPGGPIITSQLGANALTESNLKNQQLALQNQYTSEQNQFLPYKYQMQTALNPMNLMSLPDEASREAYVKNVMQSLPNFNQNNSSIYNPAMNNPFSMLLAKILGNQGQQNVNPLSNQPAVQSQPSGNSLNSMPGVVQQPSPAEDNGNSVPSPLVPASQGGLAGVLGNSTADYVKSPFKPDDVFYDSNSKRIISAASPDVIKMNQEGLSGLQRIDPLIRRLAIEQYPEQSGWTSLLKDAEGIQNRWGPESANKYFPQIEKQYPEIAKQFGLTGLALPTLQARAQSDLKTAPEQLIRIYGLKPGKYTTQELSDVIDPVKGETGSQYQQRLMEKITQMQQEEGAPYKEQLAQGFTVAGGNGENKNTSSNQKPQNAKQAIAQSAQQFNSIPIKMKSPDGKIYNVPEGKTQLFLSNGFSRAD